jgi:hypothetical protein
MEILTTVIQVTPAIHTADLIDPDFLNLIQSDSREIRGSADFISVVISRA